MAKARFLQYGPSGQLPIGQLSATIQELLLEKKHTRIAIMADDDDALEAFSKLDLQWLDPEEDYQWSGWKVQKKARKPPKRVLAGTYEQWFRWHMRSQRFRTFHNIVLMDPVSAVSNEEYGGYIDGLLARLAGKARHIVVVSKTQGEAPPVNDERRVKEVLRALLYGTRLTRRRLVEQSRQTFIPIPEDLFEKGLKSLGKRRDQYRVTENGEELLEGMLPARPSDSEDGAPGQVNRLFVRQKRFDAEDRIPDTMLYARVLDDVGKRGWVAVPDEASNLWAWLQELNRNGDFRIRNLHERNEGISHEQWEALLAPRRYQVRRILDRLVSDGKLQRTPWYREVGRPAQAYVLPEKTVFSQRRCGQCAFFASVRRRCRLWWLVNKQAPFFDNRWKQANSMVTPFEVHKMKYASRIGPHSSACMRFIDKKRDHLRRAIPSQCEICGATMSWADKPSVACVVCKTRYSAWSGKVKVMTAYEHEFAKLYHGITGGDAGTDLEAWKHEIKEKQRTAYPRIPETEDLELLAEDPQAPEPEPPRVWPQFNEDLQSKVDRLATATDITKQLSVAMVKSAINATRRIATFSRLYSGNVDPLVALQERYLALLSDAKPASFLSYEALVMKQYWSCYGLALKAVQQWFGPRKRSRFVRDFAYGPAGRARGYSPVDAAINYLHQRRLRQAERINAEVGFPGTCDGFLHKERHNSRKIGLPLDMIDPFKFADREELLLVLADQGLTWKDFKIETDRRGSNFYYPADVAKPKLDQIGSAADHLIVRYQDRDMSLREAYLQFAGNMIQILDTKESKLSELNEFVFTVASPTPIMGK